jgi:hypothetical protein
MLPPPKATFLAQEQLTNVALATVLALTPTVPPPPPPTATATLALWATGILNTGDSVSFGGVYTFQMGWIGIVNNEYVVVYAGAYRNDHDQGVLVVRTVALSTEPLTGPDEYMTPVRAGAVSVVAVESLRLTLQARDGQQFVFDVGTRQWVNP